MKIYKSTLAQLLQEAKPPFYLSQNRKDVAGKFPQRVYVVQLSARNAHGEWCELHLATPAVFAFDENANKLMFHQTTQWANELRTRMTALELELHDGLVSENDPMSGVIE